MPNFRFAKDYLLHRLHSKNRHGLHSPFVYRLVDKVIYNFNNKDIYNKIENIRTQLFSDNRVITVTDLGAGSLVNNSRQKKISDIAHSALKSPKLAQLLYRLVNDMQPHNMIELGTCLGITSLYLKNAAPDAKLFTIEGCPQTASIATGVFKKTGMDAIEQITGNFDDKLPDLINNLDQIDFVFIDGNHQKQATLNYFEWCLPKVHESTLLVFDDIYWSEGMKEAWDSIKSHPKVTATIDLFWMGLVYFKKGREKEDFLIRI